MKKLLSLFIAVLTMFCVAVLPACSQKIEGDFSVVAPDGAPALAIAKFIADDENFETDATFHYSVVSSTEINGAIVRDGAEFVIMPINLATKLYTNNGKEDYVLASVLTHGNFYVMSKSEITTPNDLIGRVVFVPNPGKVPDWTFKAALSGLDIEYVESDQAVDGKVAIKYFNTPQEFNAMLIQNPNAIGLVPEPAVSVLKGKGVNAVLDLQEMYDSENKTYPQAVLMVKASVVNQYPSLINKIKNKFADNVSWVKENTVEAVRVIKAKFDATTLNPDTITSSTIDGCKIYWQTAEQAKNQVNEYITRITAINSVAASAVNDAFFFKG